MMDHSVYDVEAYVLGSLDPEETILFEAHLATCAQCQREVAGFVPVLHRMRSLPLPEPPPPPRLEMPKRRPIAFPRALQVAAAVVLIAGGAFGGARYQQVQSDDMVTVAAMAATSSKEVRLSGERVVGRAIVGMGRRRTAFVLDGLPPAPNGTEYEVWIRGKNASPAGTLRRNADGYEVLVVDGDLLDGAQGVAVKAGGETVASGPI
jgi:Anti-sigma-K factor rskA/Putative zinc-finger